MGEVKTQVRTSDMPEEMEKSAVAVAEEAVRKESKEKDLAAFIKKRFDKEHGPSWHCIVGRNFGSWVSHQPNRFVYLYAGKVAILLFKSA